MKCRINPLNAAGCVAVIVLNWIGSASGIEPVRVVSAGTQASVREPQAAVGPKGQTYIAYGAGNAVMCSVSTDGGRSYRPGVKVGESGKLALGMRRGPRVAVNQSGLVVTAISGTLERRGDGDLWAWRSADDGATWQGPTKVNDAVAAAREGLHALAAGPGKEMFAVWLDLRHDAQEIVGAFSTDGGKTWSANQLIYASPSGTVCQCCHPSAAYDSEGTLYVMWRNVVEGARDMYLSSSRDGGKSFSKAQKLGAGTWQLDGCPMDGGAIAVGGPKTLETVWRRDKQIFRAGLDSAEQLLDAGEQPWAAATAGGTFFVWLSKRQGDLRILPPGAQKPQHLASGANDPVVAAPLAGQGPTVVAWETGPKDSAAIFAVPVEPGKSTRVTRR